MRYMMSLATGLVLIATSGCATGENKDEGAASDPQPSVGTTFDDDQLERNTNTTGTTPPGDTAGVNSRRGVNDQTGPTGRGPDADHPEAPAY